MKYERIKFLVIALKNSVEIYAWAPKPYHKFMAFKVIKLRLVIFGKVHDTDFFVFLYFICHLQLERKYHTPDSQSYIQLF